MTADHAAASAATLSRAAGVSLVIFDVDGVLTDGRITYADDGREIKSFNVQDGAAIKMLLEADIQVAIITGRQSSIVERRAAELGIRWVFQGVRDKLTVFEDLVSQLRLRADQTAHVGDDLPDLPLFEQVGLAVSVPNGHPEVRARAHHVTATAGGAGVARELCHLLLSARDLWPYP